MTDNDVDIEAKVMKVLREQFGHNKFKSELQKEAAIAVAKGEIKFHNRFHILVAY